MEDRFKFCLAFTAREEGGYVNDPRDSGNWTSGHVGAGTLVGSNYGVGAPMLLDWMGPGALLTAAQMRQLPPSIYEAIACSRYWVPLGCPEIPPGIDLMVFDFGWNRGIGTSLNLLTLCLSPELIPKSAQINENVLASISMIPVTSLLKRISTKGVKTLQKMLSIQVDGVVGPQTIFEFQKRTDLHTTAFVLALAAAQTSSYRRLTNFPIYGTGWLARTERRQAAALQSISNHLIKK